MQVRVASHQASFCQKADVDVIREVKRSDYSIRKSSDGHFGRKIDEVFGSANIRALGQSHLVAQGLNSVSLNVKVGSCITVDLSVKASLIQDVS